MNERANKLVIRYSPVDASATENTPANSRKIRGKFAVKLKQDANYTMAKPLDSYQKAYLQDSSLSQSSRDN